MSKADVEAIQKLEETISSGNPFSAGLIDEMRAVIAIAKRAIAVDETHVEKWPKWYVLDETKGKSHKPWAIERYSETQCRRHGFNQHDEPTIEENKFGYKAEMWIEVTESEALARITPQTPEKHVEPVESPDDWVTQDRVPDRDYTDEWRWVYKTSVTPWYKTNGPPHKKHGEIYNGSRFEVRCRRRDLPKPVPTRCETCDGKGGYSDGVSDEWYTCRDCYEAPVPTVERIPVRLWREHCSGNVLATINQDDEPIDLSDEPIDLSDEADEIVSDGNGGWYVEVAK